jgi:hypothetical protein
MSRRRKSRWFGGPSPEFIIDTLSTGTVRAAATLKRQSPENLAKIKQHMHDRVSQFRADGGYAVPSPALVVAGRKPG